MGKMIFWSVLIGADVLCGAWAVYAVYHAVKSGTGAPTPLEARIRASYHAATDLDIELSKILSGHYEKGDK